MTGDEGEGGPRFPLGRTLATPGAIAVAEAHGIDLGELFARHHRGDWGDVPPEDAEANESALAYGGRLLSAYGEGGRVLWIITEADRSATTVLRAEDY
jgi:hypothetical protein